MLPLYISCLIYAAVSFHFTKPHQKHNELQDILLRITLFMFIFGSVGIITTLITLIELFGYTTP